MEKTINIAFAGNPNAGKTTLFNALTGANLKVANWPGVTVEKMEGHMKYHRFHYKLVDLPGTYALTSYTMEEIIARSYILEDEVDVIINVVDASALERNLYLTLQLIELGKPVIVALNMMDIVEERGLEIDLHRLPEMLGVPVIPVSARKRTGLAALMHAVEHHQGKPLDRPQHHHAEGAHPHAHHKELVMVYRDALEDKIDILSARLQAKYPSLQDLRWSAIKLLEHDAEMLRKYPIDLRGVAKKSLESEIINEKYAFIEEVIHETVVNKTAKSQKTDRIDKFFTHSLWGVPIFLAIMALVFFFTFTIGDWLKGYFEQGLDWLSGSVSQTLTLLNTSGWAVSLVVDGILAGVGGILTFLPNIFILFLALAFLEDSGYMARVAYLMDGIMSKVGLSGRAFIPMLLGFGCTVPAVMATRTLENKRDRLKTILVTPFMSCSARLPIYVLLSDMFFGSYAMIAAYSMYVIGVLTAILVAMILNGIDKKKQTSTLLLELPEYKTPNARTVFIYVWNKVKDYLTKAGTTIFIASIILWFLLHFNRHGMVENMADSFAASAGRWLVPVLRPAGLGYWQIVVALISGIAAKEVVVSSLSVLYGIANISSNAGMSTLAGLLGDSGFTGINAYAMMLFCLLYIPCIAAIAVIRRETRSLRWTAGAIALQLGTAYFVSTLFYQMATLIKVNGAMGLGLLIGFVLLCVLFIFFFKQNSRNQGKRRNARVAASPQNQKFSPGRRSLSRKS